MNDTTFTAFVPPHKVDSPVPVVLFQSGHGSNSACHAPLLNALASEGFVCILPDRDTDTLNTPEGDAVELIFTEGKLTAALSTDGTHLAAAYEWLLAQGGVVSGQKVDTTKVAVGGFSMGAIEAINFASQKQGAGGISAVFLISSSTSENAEPLYQFKETDLVDKVSKFTIPSLDITSDKDCMHDATKKLAVAAAKPSALVVFKDEVLDNSMTLTQELSIWHTRHIEMIPGLAQHFALAAEAKVVAKEPVVGFLRRTLLHAGGIWSDELVKASDCVAVVDQMLVHNSVA